MSPVISRAQNHQVAALETNSISGPDGKGGIWKGAKMHHIVNALLHINTKPARKLFPWKFIYDGNGVNT